MKHARQISPYAKALAEHSGAMESFKVAIVAPCHIQPSQQWIEALNYAAKTATIIIVDDSNGKVTYPDNWDVYDYARQEEILGPERYKQWQMFQKSSSCKQFGMWVAHNRGFDPIIVIDSDCIIPPNFVAAHIEALLMPGDGWDNPIKGSGFYSRGFPFYERKKPIWAHMGLWENELDLYGTDRVGVSHPPRKAPYVKHSASGAMFPLSGMNLSFRNDAVPYMLFLPNFTHKDHKFTRHDDIWGGYIFQRVARAKGFEVSYGQPEVFHDTIVIPEEDAADEVPMIKYERAFYRVVDDALCMTLWWGQEDPTPSQVFDDLVEYIKENAAHAKEKCENDPHDPFVFEGLIPAFQLAADIFRPE